MGEAHSPEVYLCYSMQERGKRKWRVKFAFQRIFSSLLPFLCWGELNYITTSSWQFNWELFIWVAMCPAKTPGALLLNRLINTCFNIKVPRLLVYKCRQFTTPHRLYCYDGHFKTHTSHTPTALIITEREKRRMNWGDYQSLSQLNKWIVLLFGKYENIGVRSEFETLLDARGVPCHTPLASDFSRCFGRPPPLPPW